MVLAAYQLPPLPLPRQVPVPQQRLEMTFREGDRSITASVPPSNQSAFVLGAILGAVVVGCVVAAARA